MSTRLPSPNTLWLRTTDFVQSIQINHPFNPLVQQKSTFLTSPLNGNKGYCFSFDINNINSVISIIFYL